MSNSPFSQAGFNQAPDLVDYNLYGCDPVLQGALTNAGADWHADQLARFGAKIGQAHTLALGALANRYPPELRTHSRTGERIDSVEFHPSWHALLSLLRSQGLHALPWITPQPGVWAARTAGYFLQAQIESGSLCPTTMTFAAIPVLQKETALFASLGPKLYARQHDPRDLPWPDKASMLIGMGMTERQGGSDVRANTSWAVPVAGGGRGGEYRLNGHKWFFSAPMCDAHLVVARLGNPNDGPICCFFVPRWRPDGSKNAVEIQRLKDKLGNRSNSSSEVEFRDAHAVLIGEEGRGIPTIIEMATHTRLDCVIGSAALIRQAFVQALHHCRHREAFGRLLVDQPLMRNVLTDLALESEAATRLMMRLASAFEGADSDPLQAAWKRIVTPAAKFWVCKRALEVTGEAMEVWGGNGYVEEGPMARLYREAPVNSIWEGSGNVMCLDVLRAIQREPDGAALLMANLADGAAGEPRLLAALRGLEPMLHQPGELLQANARRLAQTLALLAQAVLLRRHGQPASAELFIASRFDGGVPTGHGRVFGTLALDSLAATQAILDGNWR